MNGRERFKWKVQLVPNGGTDPVDHLVENYWSPQFPDIQEVIKNAAAAEASVQYRHPMGAISVERLV